MTDGGGPRVLLLDGEPSPYLLPGGGLAHRHAGDVVFRDETGRDHLFGKWWKRPNGRFCCWQVRKTPARKNGNYEAATREDLENALNDSSLPLERMVP